MCTKIESNWQSTSAGQIYTARALNPSKRILGEVRLHVPVEEYFNFKSRYGVSGFQDLETAAKELLYRIAAETA